MASSLAAQLSQIAAKSTHSHNLKAQKELHSRSLIYEPQIAITQDFDTLFTVGIEGFRELCLLDGRFVRYEKSIFSAQSKSEDRTQMTHEENEALDRILEDFLGLISSKLLLRPAVKAMEWLVRRFKVHEHNVSPLLFCFLPYHTEPIFLTLLSILPSRIPDDFRFLHPYINALSSPPRHAIVYTATNTRAFFSEFCRYVLKLCRNRNHFHGLMVLWSGVATEATAAMLDMARSGRKTIQQQNTEDVAVRLLPVLNDGLSMKKVPELRLGCYMLAAILTTKGEMEDEAIDKLMEAVISGWTQETVVSGITCLSVLAQRKEEPQLAIQVTDALARIGDLGRLLQTSKLRTASSRLAYGFCLTACRTSREVNETGLKRVDDIIKARILGRRQILAVTKSLLEAAQRGKSIEDPMNATEPTMKLISALVQDPQTGPVVQEAIRDKSISVESLETSLQMVIRAKDESMEPHLDEGSDLEMGDADAAPAADSVIESRIQKLPASMKTKPSFLTHDHESLYQNINEVFTLAAGNPAHMQQISELPLLCRSAASEELTFFTFLARTWCGPSPSLARSAALSLAEKTLGTLSTPKDFQILLPYILVALADEARRVRQAATKLMKRVNELHLLSGTEEKRSKNVALWASEKMYGADKVPEDIHLLARKEVSKVMQNIVDVASECVLDKKYIGRLIEQSLTGSDDQAHEEKVDISNRLKSTQRTSFLAFLGSHIIATPLLSVKLRLLSTVNRVRKVSGASRTKLLLPVLESWITSDPVDTRRSCDKERLDYRAVQEQIFKVVAAEDQSGLDLMQQIIQGNATAGGVDREEASIQRLKDLWSSLKSAPKKSIALLFLNVAFDTVPNRELPDACQVAAKDALRSLDLSSSVLQTLLSEEMGHVDIEEHQPPSKRRRRSHGRGSAPGGRVSTEMNLSINRLTFLLEIVDGSELHKHLDMLASTFQLLGKVEQIRTKYDIELAYVQSLALDCILQILEGYQKKNQPLGDSAEIRADLLVDCVRTTSNLEVQNAALLVISKVASLAPDLVLHSVMPIFTFMGASVLRQDSEYSAHVINETIQRVIPSIVVSLQAQDRNIVHGTAELLRSFVSAFRHVPHHRRLPLFTSLIQTLGEQDFLFAALGMFVSHYPGDSDIEKFSISLASQFVPQVQLMTIVKSLDHLENLWNSQDTASETIFEVGNESSIPISEHASNVLSLLQALASRLTAQSMDIASTGDKNGQRKAFMTEHAKALKQLLKLLDILKEEKTLQMQSATLLESVLSLLPVVELLGSITSLLEDSNDQIRYKSLLALETRLSKTPSSDKAARTACLSFARQLQSLIEQDGLAVRPRIAILSCIDQIIDKYGKKDTEIVRSVASKLCTDINIGSSSVDVQVMSLTCLASAVDVLESGFVPVLPLSLPKALAQLEKALEGKNDVSKLLSAVFAFIAGVFYHTPAMVSGNDLDQILHLTWKSTQLDLDEQSTVIKDQTVQSIAQRGSPKEVLSSLERQWNKAVTSGPQSIQLYLKMLGFWVEHHPKSVVMKHSQLFGNILVSIFDLRASRNTDIQDAEGGLDIDAVENNVFEIALKAVMKMNDTTFRPIFERIVAFATTQKSGNLKNLRLTTVFRFLNNFFNTLQALVTSYVSYVMAPAADVLKSVAPSGSQDRTLWMATLQALEQSFTHDQDEFWQAPSHYSAIMMPLVSSLKHARRQPSSNDPVIASVSQAITALAGTIDSSSQHKELNSAIMAHLRDSEIGIRFAAVKCERSLTERLGEEWLALLPEMLPFISELREDDDEDVERETERWIALIEEVLGESLTEMLQ